MNIEISVIEYYRNRLLYHMTASSMYPLPHVGAVELHTAFNYIQDSVRVY